MKIRINVIVLLSALILMAAAALAQNPSSTAPLPADTRIPRNSKVYIAPMDGFETYLAAAMRKKEVPVTMVTDAVISGLSGISGVLVKAIVTA